MKQIELSHTGYWSCIVESDTACRHDAQQLAFKRSHRDGWIKRFRSPRDEWFVQEIEIQDYFTARQLPDSIFFKGRGCTYYQTHLLWGAAEGVLQGAPEMLGVRKMPETNGSAACLSMLVHVWKGSHGGGASTCELAWIKNEFTVMNY